jgi:hypothetical protein
MMIDGASLLCYSHDMDLISTYLKDSAVEAAKSITELTAKVNDVPTPETHTLGQAIVALVHQSPKPVPSSILFDVLLKHGFAAGSKFPRQAMANRLSQIRKDGYLVMQRGAGLVTNANDHPAFQPNAGQSNITFPNADEPNPFASALPATKSPTGFVPVLLDPLPAPATKEDL